MDEIRDRQRAFLNAMAMGNRGYFMRRLRDDLVLKRYGDGKLTGTSSWCAMKFRFLNAMAMGNKDDSPGYDGCDSKFLNAMAMGNRRLYYWLDSAAMFLNAMAMGNEKMDWRELQKLSRS